MMVLERLLNALPVVMSGFWGRSQLMEPFTGVMACYIFGLAYQAGQAFMYPPVQQEEREDE